MVLAHNIKDSVRTDDVQITRDITFDTMLLSSNTLKGLKDSGFLKPSPIQLHAIPLGKCGFDLLLEAKSGTGKTAVFTVIALEKINLKKGLQVMMLAPTREIASQICYVLRTIGIHYNGLNIEVVMGGLPVQADIEKFRDNKVHIVVGSPGRLKHLIQDNHIDVSAVRLLVLDEADKLMEKSFLSAIRSIHMVLPRQKQIIMSSATYPDAIKKMIAQFVHNPQHLCPSSNCVLLGVLQKISTVKYNSNIIRQTQFRFKELLKILTNRQFKQCLVFCNYQTRVGEVHKLLKKEKWPSEQLYGQQDQTDRLDALKTLQEYKCRILVSTDLAARGIDASNVDLVINFEPPYDWQTYLHRIGRAGRFGSHGMAVTILSEDAEYKKFMNLLDAIKISKLENLWSDNSINEATNEINSYSESIATPEINYNDETYKKIWTVICGDNAITNACEKFESFNELLKSLQDTTVEISSNDVPESFCSLVDSFNSNKLPLAELDVEYKNITIPKVLLDINGATIEKYEVKNILKENGEIKEGNYDISNSKSVSLINPLENKNISEVNFDPNLNFTGDPICSKRQLLNNHLCVSENSKTASYSDSEDIEFQRLEVPTAFPNGNWNIKKKKHKTKFIQKKRENEDASNFNEKEIFTNNEVSNISLGICEEPSNYNKDSHYAKLDYSSKYLNKNNKRTKESHSSNTMNKKNLSYEDWYNQLKFRVRYLERAFFIEELSKM